MSNATIGERLLTAKEVAEKLSVKVGTIYRWVSEDRFPKPIKFSTNMTRWRLDDVDAWIKEHSD